MRDKSSNKRKATHKDINIETFIEYKIVNNPTPEPHNKLLYFTNKTKIIIRIHYSRFILQAE
jgi:hypothetical protein